MTSSSSHPASDTGMEYAAASCYLSTSPLIPVSPPSFKQTKQNILKHLATTADISAKDVLFVTRETLDKALIIAASSFSASADSTSSSPSSSAAEAASLKSKSLTSPNWSQSLSYLALTSFTLLSALFCLSHTNFYLYPLGYVLAALTLSFLSLIAHDCAHNVFTPSSLLNRLLGEVALYPFGLTYTSFINHHLFGQSVERKVQDVDAQDDGTYDDAVTITATLKDRLFPTPLSSESIMVSKASSVLLVSFLSFLAYSLYSSTYPVLSLLHWIVVPYFLYFNFHTYLFSFLAGASHLYLPSSLHLQIPFYQLYSILYVVTHGGKTGAKLDSLAEWRKMYIDISPRINWLHVIFLFVVPFFGFIGTQYVPFTLPTMIWTFIYYVMTGLGITAGYHRLFAHRAYEAHPVVSFLIMLCGTGALQGSVKWWCGGHRIHHRYTDTDLDPYSAKTGFWWAHLGWMLVHPKPEHKVKADLKDLNDSAIIRWQHKHYLYVGPAVAFLFPTLVAGLGWGDWWGGFIYAGCLRLFAVHHATFCVNSVAHWFGDHTFDDNRTPRDHIITAFLTFGEGYHNFHHEFPNDYRNGIRYYDYDPTKWLIKTLNYFGLTYKLRMFPSNEIEKGKVHMKEKKIREEKAKLVYPPAPETLPLMTWAQIKAEIEAKPHGRALTVIDDLVHDIGKFIPRHPGGKAFIESSVGTDATVRFRGETGIYKHSQAAHHLLSGYRVARLSETEEERRERKEKEAERLKKMNKQI